MNESKISVRYARALFLSAREHDLVDEVRKDMFEISRLVKMDEFKDVLSNPVITYSLKRNIFTSLLKGKISDLSYKLVMLTISNNREAFLAGIARSYIGEADNHNGITRANLTTASPVGNAAREKVCEIIESDLSTKVELEEIIDPDITGGFILRVEDMFVDASVKAGLRRIKKELTKN